TDNQGVYLVPVVDPNNTVRFAQVKVGDRIGSKWVVESGLKPGERVVTDGLFKIAPGAHVAPKEAK
ncbi:MAG TPA: efflux transporter periplasmic adaptor subunit, partial [Bryobacteraceae bacterium]|nr:efflux transporter periplasmic adaptor subunit [Bryobacteraceae bacterium]